jgi:hypothetical protein
MAKHSLPALAFGATLAIGAVAEARDRAPFLDGALHATDRVPSVVFVDRNRPTWPRDAFAVDAANAAGESAEEARVQRRTRAVLVGGAATVAVYGAATWWNEGLSGEFRVRREGWFGQGTADGGADKLGHLHANYVGTRLLARAFEWAGNAPDRALTLAAWSTLGTFIGVEVLDAFTPRYRFSPEDAIMNAVGVGLGVLMERRPQLDALLDLRLLYKPSNDPRLRGGFDPFGDYSGQTYLLVGKASGVPTLRDRPFLRYLEIAVGYGTRGFEVGPENPGDRSRNLYFGISLNLAELLNHTAFAGRYRDGIAHRAARGFLEVFQVPGTTALASRKL